MKQLGQQSISSTGSARSDLSPIYMTRLTVIQILPALNTGGVERGTLDVAAELVRRGHRSIVISGGGELSGELKSSGSEHIPLEVGKKSLLTLRHIPELRRIMHGAGAHIVHARSRLPAWISWLAWRGMDPENRPHYITSVHGPYTVNAYSRIMTRGEIVIAVSKFIRGYILENYPGVESGRIEVIARGISPERYTLHYHPDILWLEQWHTQFPHLRDKQLVTLPGRLTRWKGQMDFLTVMAQLKDNIDNVHGLIVGGPHPRKQAYVEELKAEVARRGLEQWITLTGHRSDLREIMSISSVTMSLSNEPEAFGRTVLESLCLGTPVVSYAHGGAGEILGEMFPEGLVENNNPLAAANLTEVFLRETPEVPSHNPFTLQRMLDHTLEVYERVARMPGRHPQ